MKITNAPKYVLGIFAAAGLLAGCNGGSQSPLSPSGPSMGSNVKGQPSPELLQRLSIAAHPGLVAPHPNMHASWIAPDVKADRHHKRRLLYISSFYSDEVDIYNLKTGALKGTLTGFSNPQGECVDAKGDVWVANTDASDVEEFARGATSPTKTLQDSGYYPVGCAINPKTGDLAVSNIFSTGDTNGGVVIFSKASGSGTSYSVSNVAEGFFVGYDNNGDLFVDGHPVLFGSGFAFAELPSGSSSFETITLNQSIGFPGGVGFDGKYVTVDDQDASNTVYQFTISGTSGTVEGHSTFSGPSDMLGYSFLKQKYNGTQSTILVGPDGVGEDTYTFHYPAGGSAVKTFADGLDENSGAAVTPGSNE